jgi:signal transduction histidine kinase
MNLKAVFIKHLSVITIIFPLLTIIFYGIATSLTLEYQHNKYEELELKRYENELKNKHVNFFKEKVKYIDSFINFLSLEKNSEQTSKLTDRILLFVESLKKYDSGFIFVFKQDGTVLKHPCANRLIELVESDMQINKDAYNILYKLLNAARYNQFINYKGTDCINDRLVNKIAFVHHIKNTDLYVVISKNEKDIADSIEKKKKILEQKLHDELRDMIKLLLIVCLVSVIFSLFFSKFINMLIKDYEKEIKRSHNIMFSQSRLAQAGELLSMISHQWRQPISKIASITSNLRFKIILGEKINIDYLDEKCNEIEDYTEFLSETIDDFREFYKPKKDKEPIYIQPIIEKSLNFLENEINKKSIKIHKEFGKDAKILLYKNELMQVIINIVQNAIDFSPKGASIHIETLLKLSEYIIMVIDEAGGIKEENINKVFDAHFSTKNGKNSTNLGLGLYVSKVIIEQHFNGKLEVESRGKSSKFTIRLIRYKELSGKSTRGD